MREEPVEREVRMGSELVLLLPEGREGRRLRHVASEIVRHRAAEQGREPVRPLGERSGVEGGCALRAAPSARAPRRDASARPRDELRDRVGFPREQTGLVIVAKHRARLVAGALHLREHVVAGIGGPDRKRVPEVCLEVDGPGELRDTSEVLLGGVSSREGERLFEEEGTEVRPRLRVERMRLVRREIRRGSSGSAEP